MRPPSLIFFFFLALLFLHIERLFAQEAASGAPPKITAGFYAFFLDHAAKNDPHGLYDEKMALSTTSPRILRVGTPGNYCYLVSEEEKNLPLFYLNTLSAIRCCNWLENRKFFEDPNSEFEISEGTEVGVYEFAEDQICSVNEQSTYFLINENGYEWNPSNRENSDLLLISSCSSCSLGSASFQDDGGTAMTLNPSSQKDTPPSKHPLARKALKVFVAYFCPTCGIMLGATAGNALADYYGCNLLIASGVIIGGCALGLVVGILVTDFVWSMLNSWLGPPT